MTSAVDIVYYTHSKPTNKGTKGNVMTNEQKMVEALYHIRQLCRTPVARRSLTVPAEIIEALVDYAFGWDESEVSDAAKAEFFRNVSRGE